MGQHLQQVWREFLKNIDIYITILIAIALSFFGIINVAPAQVTQSIMLTVLAILAFSILKNRQTDETIETTLQQVAKPLLAKINIYKRQEDAYKFLGEYIKHHYVRESVLIQYSCISAMSVLRTILSCGATVTVYIQDEKTSTSIGAYEQADRTTHWRKSIYLYDEFADLLHSQRLKICKYDAPGSVSGIKIDLGTEQILCMGWYIYEHVDASNRSPAYPSDTVQVSGHDIGAVIVWSGTEEFEALNETFKMLEKNYQANSEEWTLP